MTPNFMGAMHGRGRLEAEAASVSARRGGDDGAASVLVAWVDDTLSRLRKVSRVDPGGCATRTPSTSTSTPFTRFSHGGQGGLSCRGDAPT